MSRIFILALMSLALPGGVATAQEGRDESPQGEIQLSDDTVQLRYLDDGDRVADGSRVSASFFLSEQRDIVLSGDLLFPARVGFDRLQLRFGPRAYAALLEEENNDVLAMSLGVELRLELDSRSGLAIAGQAFHAPDVLTFGSADNLTDLSARIEMRLQPRLIAFGGMRWFEFELTPGSVPTERTLQEELFVGVGWKF